MYVEKSNLKSSRCHIFTSCTQLRPSFVFLKLNHFILKININPVLNVYIEPSLTSRTFFVADISLSFRVVQLIVLIWSFSQNIFQNIQFSI